MPSSFDLRISTLIPKLIRTKILWVLKSLLSVAKVAQQIFSLDATLSLDGAAAITAIPGVTCSIHISISAIIRSFVPVSTDEDL